MSDQEPAALISFFPFTNLTPEKVKTIIQQLKNGDTLCFISSNPTSKIQYIPADDKTIFFRKYDLRIALKKLENHTPDDILNIISVANLEGHGGAFFPTAKKWKSCKESDSAKKYIICNAEEEVPGTFIDKSLLNSLSGLVIEGMIISAYLTGAANGFIYLRAEYNYLLEKIENTLREFQENNLLGNDILGIPKFNFNIQVQLGAGAYVCGEIGRLRCKYHR